MSSGRNMLGEARGGHERIVRLQKRADQEKRLAAGRGSSESAPTPAPRSFRNGPAPGSWKRRPRATEPWRSSSSRAPFHGSPKSRHKSSICGMPGAGIGAAQLVGVELGLRPQILIPVVEIQVVIEAVRLRIHEVHLADRARSCSPRGPKWCAMVFFSKGHGVAVVERAVIVRVEAGEQRRARGHAHRIRAVGAVETHGRARQRIEIGRARHRIAIHPERVRPMLVGHEQQDVLRPRARLAERKTGKKRGGPQGQKFLTRESRPSWVLCHACDGLPDSVMRAA